MSLHITEISQISQKLATDVIQFARYTSTGNMIADLSNYHYFNRIKISKIRHSASYHEKQTFNDDDIQLLNSGQYKI